VSFDPVCLPRTRECKEREADDDKSACRREQLLCRLQKEINARQKVESAHEEDVAKGGGSPAGKMAAVQQQEFHVVKWSARLLSFHT
jgi:hypothetical protein